VSERLRKSSYWSLRWPNRANTPSLPVSIWARLRGKTRRGKRSLHVYGIAVSSATVAQIGCYSESLQKRLSHVVAFSVFPHHIEGLVPPRSTQGPDRKPKVEPLRGCRARIRTPGLARLALECFSHTLDPPCHIFMRRCYPPSSISAL
jgi:hypothetical protein